jgi:hypothetical protein
LKRLLLIALVSSCLLYIGDYATIRYKIARNRNPFGGVTVRRYYAVPQKSRKTELYFDQPETLPCIHSLFPHFGCSPCWYLNRRKVNRIKV